MLALVVLVVLPCGLWEVGVPSGVSQLKRLRWGMPMTLHELTGLLPGHLVGSLPAKRFVVRHDANRTVYHIGATATGHVSSNEMEGLTARQVCSFACSAAPIADGATVLTIAPRHPPVWGKIAGRRLNRNGNGINSVGAYAYLAPTNWPIN